jgi:flagellar hook-length control protein FliK
MQFSAPAPVDLMSTARPASTSAGKTGQDDAFANHLATASQGQTAKTRNSALKHTDQSTTSTPEDTSTQTETLSEPDSEHSRVKTLPADPKSPDQKESSEDLATDTTINGAAGAANAAIPEAQQTVHDATRLAEQSRAQASDQTNSIVSRMLNAITSATAGTTAAASTATVPSGQSAMQSSAQPQTFTIGEQPTLPSSASPPIAMAKNMEVALGVRLNSSGGSGTLQTDDTAVQTREFYLSGAETTQNNGTTNPQNPLAQIMSSTPPDLAQIEPEAAQSIAQQNAAQQNNEQIVQNKYGQIITIHQLSEPEEMAAATGIAGQPAATDTSGQSKEVNSNYIRSHLPNDAPKTVANENHTKQQDTTKDNQPKGTNTAEALADGLSQTEQTATPKPQFTIGTENQPLVFAHQRTSAPLAASTSSTDALTLRLPSGLTVPDGAVVDQMLSHFSVNKQLESGTINLKLHPQELGELRMEIKVEQDNIKAHIVAQNPQAQEMIERHLPRLRETLAQQGLQLQHIEVTVAAHDNAGGERYQDNSRQQLNQSQHKSTSQSMFTLDSEEEMVESASSVNNLSVLA